MNLIIWKNGEKQLVGLSWADQWDSDPLPQTNRNSKGGKSAGKKVGEGLEKTKAAASSGFKKVKASTSVGFHWIKDKCKFQSYAIFKRMKTGGFLRILWRPS
ncbi:hypothetical protein NE237_023474 [Protea cynaroides]|uniref:Uncharacterized protein n=1 Tax=Protea cynaroides TaxID=273540 RepID=A0A9Q0HF45_9MAGN|nr:hypothetical protein NE237_023474 [Protea cynaroides]